MYDFDSLSVEDLLRGYTREDGVCRCLQCGAAFEDGQVYPLGGRYYEAGAAAGVHVGEAHPDRFYDLLAGDGKRLSLTENQQGLMKMIYEGLSDRDIAAKTGVSPSTVRHQRFVFREKAKAAKLYLAVWDLASANIGKGKELLPVHDHASMVDDRYVITEEENEKILNNVFSSLSPLTLKVFPPKQKKKLVILKRIAAEFEKGRRYTEKEINAVLSGIFDDYVTLRRYLIEYGFMDRTTDCREYWML